MFNVMVFVFGIPLHATESVHMAGSWNNGFGYSMIPLHVYEFVYLYVSLVYEYNEFNKPLPFVYLLLL